jgi:aldose 1-epimerase
MLTKMSRAVPSSGRQVELAHRGQRATVVEVGGGLRTYTIDGHAVVDGYDSDEVCPGASGQVLLPWPNRLSRGAYDFGGVRHQLPLTEPSSGCAIHGLVRFVNWEVSSVAAASAVLTYRLHPQPGYPFCLDVRAEYALDDTGLAVRLSATNLSPGPCPFGAGAHPYVIGTSGVDGLELSLPAASRYETDGRGIPQRRVAVERTPYDFRQPRPLAGVVLDTAFADLDVDDAGRMAVTVTDTAAPGPTRRTTVWADRAFGHLMAYTGDTLPDPARRRRGLAVEPMTCAPDAFNSGDGLRVLEPAETFSGSWGITCEGLEEG